MVFKPPVWPDVSAPRLLPPDSAKNLMDYFHEQGFTNGDPVIFQPKRGLRRRSDGWCQARVFSDYPGALASKGVTSIQLHVLLPQNGRGELSGSRGNRYECPGSAPSAL